MARTPLRKKISAETSRSRQVPFGGKKGGGTKVGEEYKEKERKNRKKKGE